MTIVNRTPWCCWILTCIACSALAACAGAKKPAGTLEWVIGEARIIAVQPELLSAHAKTSLGKRLVYWDEHTTYYRAGKQVPEAITIQPGDRFEFRGADAYGEIYLTRVNYPK